MTFKEMDGLTLADLIGVPYKDNGRDLAGLDCYGLAIIAVYLISKKRLRDIVYNNHNAELSDKFAPTLNIKKTSTPAPSNIIEMTFNNEIHIGVIINEREYIHATRNQGARISLIKCAPIKNIYEVI